MLAGGAELELGCQEEGRGRSRHPRPTILPTQLSAPGSPGGDRDRLAEARAVSRNRRGDRIKGATGGPHTCSSSHNKAQNRSSVQSDDSESNTQGSPTAGRGHAIRIPPSHPDAPIRQPEGSPRPLAAGRTPAGSATRVRRGHGPSGGSPPTPSPTQRLGDRPTLSSDQGGQRPRDIPGLSPSGGPGCPTAALVSGDRACSVRPPEVAKAQVPGLGPGE